EFGIDRDAVLQDAEQQDQLFYRLFPAQVEQGPQKAPTFKWLVTRCADGTGKTAPRELIHLLNCILEQEIKRLEQGGGAAPRRPTIRSVRFQIGASDCLESEAKPISLC